MPTSSTPTEAERHISRTRASSTSRTIGLFRTSFLIAYSKASIVPPVRRRLSPLQLFRREQLLRRQPRERAKLRASRPRVPLALFVCRDERLLRQHLHARALLGEGTHGVLHNPVLERVEGNH